MIRNLIIIFLLAANAVAAQNALIKGVVKDIASHSPLSHVTVSTGDNRYNTITNIEGAFALFCPEESKKITFSCIGYAPYNVNVSSLPKDGVYYLEPKDLVLEEILIMNTPMWELIKMLKDNSIAALVSPVLLSTYYREFTKINDTHTKFADGLIDFNLSKKRKKIKADLGIKQSRAVELDTFKESTVRALGPDVRKIIPFTCGFDVLDIVFDSKKSYKKYEFLIKSLKQENGEPLAAITFSPNPESKEALFRGTIIYHQEKKIILDFDIELDPEFCKYVKVRNILLARFSFEHVSFKSSFKIVDGVYLPSYSNAYGTIHIWNKNYDNTYRFRSDLIVTNHSIDVSQFNREGRYRSRSLYDAGNNYTDKFWLSNNSILLTAEEEEIIKSLANK